MDRGVPCCVADAARRTRKIRVDGNLIGVLELDRILEEVRAEGHEDRASIRAALIERAKSCNYINPKTEKAYADALQKEYDDKYGSAHKGSSV
jgi:hypothetical protein